MGIVKAICILLGAAYLGLVAYAQATCSIFPSFGTQCHDERGDVWMLPFFLAPFGMIFLLFAVIAVIMTVRGE